MKIVNMCGFSGNRAQGIRALQQVAGSEDMRSHISRYVMSTNTGHYEPFDLSRRKHFSIPDNKLILLTGHISNYLGNVERAQ